MQRANAPRTLYLARLVALGACFASVSPSTAQSKLDVRFGIIEIDTGGQATFVETTRVSNLPGQSYGWVATIEPSAEPISWTEELRLPREPARWELAQGPAQALSDDRTAVRTSGVLRPGETRFSNFWTITAGDPNGTYSIIVKVFDGVVADIAFEVVPAQ
jgi:hypothetical protein